VQSQRALATASWTPGGAVRVRIGLHTGEPIPTTDGYAGLDVIRAVRIKEAGHGGQVLLSASTAAIVQDALGEEVSLRDLGVHRLKSLPRPERLFQLLIPGLPRGVGVGGARSPAWPHHPGERGSCGNHG